jgi:hypothetical protein
MIAATVASSDLSIRALASNLRLLPRDRRTVLAGYLMAEGLMFPPIHLWPIFWVLRRIRGKQGLYNFVAILSQIYPRAIDGIIADTAKHMLDGRDTEDADSVGGFSQRELNLIVRYLNSQNNE